MSRPAYTSVGCYPLVYVLGHSCYCAECAPEAAEASIHWEGDPIECEECGTEIESAYGTV